MRAIFEYFGLDEGTTDFIGHALALQQTEDYLGMAAYPTVMAIKMYAESMARFGGDSPYIYPLYGLGELPQAFARLSAVYGGTYMLNKPGCEVVYDEESGRACGVRSEGETAKAPIIVGDPSYFRDKCRLTQKVIRAMCIMSHPIPNTGDGANGAERSDATHTHACTHSHACILAPLCSCECADHHPEQTDPGPRLRRVRLLLQRGALRRRQEQMGRLCVHPRRNRQPGC
jgi:hypothetical protein